MDKLSYEVLSLIVGNLDVPLAQFATLSRAWQSVVEARIFSHVRFQSGSMDIFDSALGPSQDRRRKILKKLVFNVVLPKSNELRVEYRKNLVVFRQAVTALFERLATWEERDRHLEVVIETSRTFHAEYDNTQELEDQGFCVSNRSDTYGGRSAAGRRYLALRKTDLQTVPKVACVGALDVDNSYGFSIHPAAAFLMARSFLGLEELKLSYYDPAKRRRALRQEHRQAMADGVRSLHELPRLKKLLINCLHNDDPADHGYEIQDFRDEQGVDALCDALRCLGQAGNLVELHLDGTLVCPDLFRNPRLPAGQRDATPWPALELFRVTQRGIAGPDGRWYGTGDPTAEAPGSPADTYGAEANDGRMYDSDDSGVDSDEISDDDGDDEDADCLANGDAPYHAWRTELDPDVFNPLAMAMAAAALAMPNLKRGTLELGSGPAVDMLPYVLECATRGQEMTWDQYIASAPSAAQGRRWRMVLRQGVDWEPPKELLEMWNEWVGPDGTAETVVLEKLDGYEPQYLWCGGASWRPV